MRGIFGLVGLLLVLAVVGWTAKTQFNALNAPPALPQDTPSAGTPPLAAGSTPAQQSQAIQQQVKSQVEAAIQQSRTAAEDAP